MIYYEQQEYVVELIFPVFISALSFLLIFKFHSKQAPL